MITLAIHYGQGEGVTKDPTEAAKWLRLAAEQGDVSSQTALGWRYVIGEGVAVDYAEARKWLSMAANQGDAIAQRYLGGIYSQGVGVMVDPTEAEKWYRLAAEGGDAEAKAWLAENNNSAELKPTGLQSETCNRLFAEAKYLMSELDSANSQSTAGPAARVRGAQRFANEQIHPLIVREQNQLSKVYSIQLSAARLREILIRHH